MIKHVKSISVAFCLIVISANQSYADVPTLERDALVALYNSTGGTTTWTNNDSWDVGTPCSPVITWYGVTCDGTYSHVIGLDLFQNGLSGTLPNELASLTELKSLTLSFNNLTGSIPLFLSTFSQLQTLYFQNNDFAGTIPPQLSLLTQLTTLQLNSNQLVGPIPKELGLMTNLEGLALDRNKLSGSIPTELGLLTKLTFLYLDDNLLCGEIPSSLLNLVLLSDNSGLYLGMNFLYTNDSALDAFLVQKGGDWKSSQEPRNCFSWPMFLPAITYNGP